MIIKTPPKLTNRNSIINYIEVYLWSWLKDLYIAILKINFKDNFQSFSVSDLSIPAGIEVSISNDFNISNKGYIPSARIITRQKGDATIVDGDTPWTDKHVYLKNPSANDVIISVVFLK